MPSAVPASSAAARTVSADRTVPPPSLDEISQGLWWLYQLQYDKARELFDHHIHADPNDPSGYFYKAAVDWWQIAQDFELPQPELEKRFEADYRKTIRVCKALREKHPNARARGRSFLYEGGANGLWGRWQVTRGKWIKAYSAGKAGDRLLKKALEVDPTQYDAYLGLGIYDYYTDALSGVQKVLSKLLIHGNRKRGLQELERAIAKGPHSRVEAQLFLIEIYASHEHAPQKALTIAQRLHEEFPLSPAMHLAYISAASEAGEWGIVKRDAVQFRTQCEKESPYYRRKGLAAADYYLGLAALKGDRDPSRCLQQMEKVQRETPGASRWLSFAYLRRAQSYDLLHERQKALKNYRAVLSRADVWGSHDEAERYMKKPFTLSAASKEHS